MKVCLDVCASLRACGICLQAEYLMDLLENRIPPGVDDAAYVKASFLAAVAKSTETSPILTKEHATCKKPMPRYRFCDFLAMASRPFFLRF